MRNQHPLPHTCLLASWPPYLRQGGVQNGRKQGVLRGLILLRRTLLKSPLGCGEGSNYGCGLRSRVVRGSGSNKPVTPRRIKIAYNVPVLFSSGNSKLLSHLCIILGCAESRLKLSAGNSHFILLLTCNGRYK